MASKIPQSPADLERHLREQLGFLERSAESFDKGYADEAKRLAVTIRILVHDTPSSQSLLSQLNRKTTQFCDSAFELDRTSLTSHAGLAGVYLGPKGVKHVASLDGDDPSWFRSVDFDTWWNAVVIRDQQGRELTRRDLVLTIANQDGGAHVDPTLDEHYARLSRENTLERYTTEDGEPVPLMVAELASVRQIAHELLKTLKPGYTKKPPPAGGVVIGNPTVHFTPAARPPFVQTSTGRNDLCPCGSGKKFKRCHGAT